MAQCSLSIVIVNERCAIWSLFHAIKVTASNGADCLLLLVLLCASQVINHGTEPTALVGRALFRLEIVLGL